MRDALRVTYAVGICSGSIRRLVAPPGQYETEPLRALCAYYLDHRFHILGSGWVRVQYGMRCLGLEGHRYPPSEPVYTDPRGDWLSGRVSPANLPEARRIWSLVDTGYIPIDWQLDIKSGYRWSERQWYLNIPFGHVPGADIKVPWELARMQHLPQLALASATLQLRDEAFALRCAAEVRNQVLDFLATNPPRFGVNWISTMDVAIRVVNWLIAWDVLMAGGHKFDQAFQAVFVRSIYEHGRHIFAHLGLDRRLRTNHYLADLTGLLFVSAYLEGPPEVKLWRRIASREFIREMRTQFDSEGTNFEGSTCYHGLSTEMAVYGSAILWRLVQEGRSAVQWPRWLSQLLALTVDFTRRIIKPNGLVPQFGDNDSGRLVKLRPAVEQMTVGEAKRRYANLAGFCELPDESLHFEERSLDHRHLLDASRPLLQGWRPDDPRPKTVEEWIVSGLSGGIPPSCVSLDAVIPSGRARIGDDRVWRRLRAQADGLPAKNVHMREIVPGGGGLLDDLELYGYPAFGLFVFRSRRLFLAVRCGSIGQRGIGGHAHNDQLAVELSVDGVDWIVDPGTYLYTPLPQRRQEYRSVEAHFTPRLRGRGEPGRLDLGLFRLGDQAKARCLYFGPRGFVGVHRGFGPPVFRRLELGNERLVICDYCPRAPLASFGIERVSILRWPSGRILVSPGYGVQYATH